ncbi:MAG: hypothetical protein EPN84_08515 [Legionella sp.]|nr:MAG: hypothetical protein EPN84_08515 [Legionella sp.]
MPNNISKEKITKTMAFLGGLNIFFIPSYLSDSSFNLLLNMALNAWVIYRLHEMGKPLPVSTRVKSCFFELPSEEFEGNYLTTIAENIVNGGTAKYNHLFGCY